MSKWQPIETAPKDGTRFLAAWPWYDETGWGYAVMHYRGGTLVVNWDFNEGRGATHWKPIKQPKVSK
jgi:hypothetical protein